MSIKVSCQCGQRFSAPDSIAGKRVKCPQCASPLQIPSGKSPPSNSGANRQGAPQALASSNDIFGVDDLSALEGHQDPLGLEAQSPGGGAPQVRHGLHANPYGHQPAAAKGPPAGLWIGLAAGGGALALLVIVAVVVGAMMMGGNDRQEVSQQDGENAQRLKASTVRVEQPQVKPNRGGAASPGGGASSPTQNSTPTPTPSSNDAQNTKETIPVSTLAKVAPEWAFDSKAARAGTRKSGDEKLVIQYYSWMVDLLPELGHQQIYDRFDFEKSWMKPENQRVCHELIPQFLNPLDDRERLDDPRFPAFAVTHFAGMSGVEDLPNDRAAEWARAHPAAGVFGYHDMARRQDITDGTSNTIMIVGTGRIVEPWAIGGGATIRGAREPLFGKFNGLGSVGLPKPGVIVVMADGSIRHISSDIDPKVFKAMCTIHGAEPIDLKAAGVSQVQDDWFVQ